MRVVHEGTVYEVWFMRVRFMRMVHEGKVRVGSSRGWFMRLRFMREVHDEGS